MNKIKPYLQLLSGLYGDDMAATPGCGAPDALAQVPEPLRAFYSAYERLSLPFGSVYPIEHAIRASQAEPFRSEAWFAFGCDSYFSFWLCAYDADAQGRSFTSWDHDSGAEIGDAVYGDLLSFLEGMREDYAEQSEQDFAPIGTDQTYQYAQLLLTGVGKEPTKTLVFLKQFFGDTNFQQTKERLCHLPILLRTAVSEELDALEQELAAKGLDYKRETRTQEEFFAQKRRE